MKVGLALAGAHLVGCGDDDGADSGPVDGGSDAGMADTGADAGGDAGGDDAGDDAGGDAGADAGSDTGADAGEMCSGDAISADVSDNHGHELTIPVADILAGTEKTYVTGGVTSHCHMVTLTVADFAALQAGETVRVVSCNNTEHEFALSCVAMPTAEDAAPTCGGSDEGRFTGTCTGDTFSP